VSLDALAGLMLAYAVLLLVAAWLAERLPAPREGRRATESPWALTEAARFRRGMARVVRVVAVFLILAVLVRLHETVWLWPSLVVLGLVALVEALSVRRTARLTSEPDRVSVEGRPFVRPDGTPPDPPR
jgi:hypothetical protein